MNRRTHAPRVPRELPFEAEARPSVGPGAMEQRSESAGSGPGAKGGPFFREGL
jgi:hypothetical protein